MRRSRLALVAAGVALVAASATACQADGPKCLESHTVVTYQTVYSATTKTTRQTPVLTVICDRYAEVTPSGT